MRTGMHISKRAGKHTDMHLRAFRHMSACTWMWLRKGVYLKLCTDANGDNVVSRDELRALFLSKKQ